MSQEQGIGITVGGQRLSGTQGVLTGAVGPVRSLYLHVPFCAHKCHYCDFYSFVDSRDRQEAFVAALILELRAMQRLLAGGLESIFVGGGTPSLLRVELWERLLDEVRTLVPGFPAPSLEFTVECNPESLTPELARTLAGGGVNRLSMGAQSFDPGHLKTLERIHQPANVERGINIAAEAGIRRRNIDLIYAIPGQTLDDWARDLGIACAFADRGMIDHISAYALTYEPNTAMTMRLERGEFTPAEDSLEGDMYDRAVEHFASVGLERYEVSNFARSGSECRHNLVYWRCGQWLAAGPSASGHVAGTRWKNVPKLGEWMEGVEASGGFSPAVDVEQPDAERALREWIMMGLRTREGLDHERLLAESRSLGCRNEVERELASLLRREQILIENARVRLRAHAYLWCDGIASRLMGAINRSTD